MRSESQVPNSAEAPDGSSLSDLIVARQAYANYSPSYSEGADWSQIADEKGRFLRELVEIHMRVMPIPEAPQEGGFRTFDPRITWWADDRMRARDRGDEKEVLRLEQKLKRLLAESASEERIREFYKSVTTGPGSLDFLNPPEQESDTPEERPTSEEDAKISIAVRLGTHAANASEIVARGLRKVWEWGALDKGDLMGGEEYENASTMRRLGHRALQGFKVIALVGAAGAIMKHAPILDQLSGGVNAEDITSAATPHTTPSSMPSLDSHIFEVPSDDDTSSIKRFDPPAAESDTTHQPEAGHEYSKGSLTVKQGEGWLNHLREIGLSSDLAHDVVYGDSERSVGLRQWLVDKRLAYYDGDLFGMNMTKDGKFPKEAVDHIRASLDIEPKVAKDMTLEDSTGRATAGDAVQPQPAEESDNVLIPEPAATPDAVPTPEASWQPEIAQDTAFSIPELVTLGLGAVSIVGAVVVGAQRARLSDVRRDLASMIRDFREFRSEDDIKSVIKGIMNTYPFLTERTVRMMLGLKPGDSLGTASWRIREFSRHPANF